MRSDAGSNLSFTAKLQKRNHMTLLEKTECSWFLAPQKWLYGTSHGTGASFWCEKLALTEEFTGT